MSFFFFSFFFFLSLLHIIRCHQGARIDQELDAAVPAGHLQAQCALCGISDVHEAAGDLSARAAPHGITAVGTRVCICLCVRTRGMFVFVCMYDYHIVVAY